LFYGTDVEADLTDSSRQTRFIMHSVIFYFKYYLESNIRYINYLGPYSSAILHHLHALRIKFKFAMTHVPEIAARWNGVDLWRRFLHASWV